MIYPDGRTLHFGYGTGLDDSISRLSFLADDDGFGGIDERSNRLYRRMATRP